MDRSGLIAFAIILLFLYIWWDKTTRRDKKRQKKLKRIIKRNQIDLSRYNSMNNLPMLPYGVIPLERALGARMDTVAGFADRGPMYQAAINEEKNRDVMNNYRSMITEMNARNKDLINLYGS